MYRLKRNISQDVSGNRDLEAAIEKVNAVDEMSTNQDKSQVCSARVENVGCRCK